MLKKALLATALLASSTGVMAAQKLPYVGSYYVDFTGQPDEMYWITITKKGNVYMSLTWLEPSTAKENYIGKYQQYIPYDGGYLQIKNGKAYLLNKDKRLRRDCFTLPVGAYYEQPGQACISNLTPPAS